MAFLSRRHAACLALFAMLACAPEPESPLANRTFHSTRVTEDGAPRALVPETRLELQLFETDVIASAGCNDLSGTYELDDGRFVMSDGSQTQVPCNGEWHEQDDWYFAFLLSEPSFAIDGNLLVLEGGGTRIELLD